ncbi:chromosomal replication initiator protein DnaA [Bengtsoniella intestinalis]|uniref:chromosomal replication initiator protein DnaA n=1 Tax=Bengtsoniella intestinalis TaxID=3073143 RepID=UPI00391F1B1A
MNSVADIWDNVITQLKSDLSETTVSTWFDQVEPVDVQGNTFVLYCPNDFKTSYIKKLFMKNIQARLFDIFSTEFDVSILDEAAYADIQGTTPTQSPDQFISDEFTFSNFVVGPQNQLAYAASCNVAEKPAKTYNPLFIYGESGLGKTHLLYAIANGMKKNNAAVKIAYVKGDDLTNELVTAIREGKTAQMREKYRQADLLLVDDIQFIAGKQQTQEEFFHTFNTLYENKKQIVLTSDRPPKEMSQLEDRLRTRFEWGLLADVYPPDFETRMAIIQNKAAMHGMDLPERIICFIAENVTSNVRQIEGTINKILAYKDLLGDDADEVTVTRAIQDILKRASEYMPSPDDIVDYCSKYFNQEPDVIRGQQRVRDAVSTRHIAIYLIRTMTNLSLEDIGKYFDNRDHSTVLYSIKEVEKKIKKDAAYAEMIKEIKTNIAAQQ